VLATIKDEKQQKDDNNDGIVDYYEPIVITANDYYPFGMVMPNRSFSLAGSGYRFGFNTQEKDDEVYGAGNLNTAEFWEYDTRIGRRWNTDPVVKVWESPYLVNSGNPIRYIDPKGDDWVEGKDGGIKWNKNVTGANDKDLKKGEIYRGKSFERIKNWNNVTLGNGTTVNNMVLEKYGTNKKMTYDEFQSASIFIDGAIRTSNDKIGDVTINVRAYFSSGTSRIMDGSFAAVAGGFGNGAPENGSYTASDYQDRSPKGWYNKGMNRDGIGFSLNLNPQFSTGRTDLRIHPDGNNEGTLGCIGVLGNAATLTRIATNLNMVLRQQKSINTTINITGNPNNNGRSGKKIPNVNE
jgi:hypothetical protein